MTTTWADNGEMRCSSAKSNLENAPSERRLDVWFKLVDDRRSRRLLTILHQSVDEVVNVSELEERFYEGIVEPIDTASGRCRVHLRSDFHHRLLPKLASAGIVDCTSDGVRFTPRAEFETLLSRLPDDLYPTEPKRSSANDSDGRAHEIVLTGLADFRRRHVLHRLRIHESMSLSKLADEVAVSEYEQPLGELSAESVHEVYLSLYHNHVPHLEEANLVEYNQRDGRVALSDRTKAVERYGEFLPKHVSIS